MEKSPALDGTSLQAGGTAKADADAEAPDFSDLSKVSEANNEALVFADTTRDVPPVKRFPSYPRWCEGLLFAEIWRWSSMADG